MVDTSQAESACVDKRLSLDKYVVDTPKVCLGPLKAHGVCRNKVSIQIYRIIKNFDTICSQHFIIMIENNHDPLTLRCRAISSENWYKT